MYSFIKHYEQKNKFNEDIIRDFRAEDDMVEYLEDVCRAQANTIPYIEYIGCEVERDENQLTHKYKVPIAGSRVSMVTFEFRIEYKDEVETVKMPILIPKLVDNYFFIINGNKQFAIYQNVDSSTYNTRDSVILKSLLMPIILKSDVREYRDIEDNTYTVKTYLLNLFKKKSIILLYYFAAFGFNETLEYFGVKEDIELILEKETKDLTQDDDHIIFKVQKNVHLSVTKARFEEDDMLKSIVGCLIQMFGRKARLGNIYDIEHWQTKLGATFTTNTNNQLAKAESVLLSFKRILDDRTKKNLRIPEDQKKDTFTLIYWMMRNFDKLIKMDNLSLNNKRLRLAEYQINGFNRRMSTNTYRILNSKTISMAKLKSIFTIPQSIILSELMTSELMRLNNAVNDLDLFTCALKYSNHGPSSLGEGSKKTVSSAYRAIHISHLERYSLNACSASDPGLSGALSPFIETDGLYYATDAVSEDGFDIVEDGFDGLE